MLIDDTRLIYNDFSYAFSIDMQLLHCIRKLLF
jgi:hypothetical protein